MKTAGVVGVASWAGDIGMSFLVAWIWLGSAGPAFLLRFLPEMMLYLPMTLGAGAR